MLRIIPYIDYFWISFKKKREENIKWSQWQIEDYKLKIKQDL